MAVRFRVYEAGSATVDTEIEISDAARRLAELTERFGARPTVDTGYTFGVKFVYPAAKCYVNGATVAEIRAAYAAQRVTVRRCETDGCDNVVEGTARFCADCSEAAIELENAEPVAMVLADGTYTLVYANDEYFTFRVRSLRTGRLAGRRVVEFLSGPQNELDFEAFGFANENTINVWRRFERGHLVNRAREIEAMSRNDRAALEAAGLRYAERSSRCRNCNRVLTVPASLASGYGPDCAANLGVEYGATEPTSGNGRTSARRRTRRTETAQPTVETRGTEIDETDCPRCGDPVSVCGGCPVATAAA